MLNQPQRIIYILLLTLTIFAEQETGLTANGKLIVGTKETKPFAMKDEQGKWFGISIELWEHIAEELEIDYEFRELDIEKMIEGIQKKEIDAAIAAMSITAEREQLVDFSHPYYVTGLGIAASLNDNDFIGFINNLFSWHTFRIILTLAFLLLLTGFAVWLFERKRNPEQFGGSTSKGLTSGFWWSAVTMTTVGYGDKAPLTLGGRITALVWMFAGLIMISSFTAAITSQLTVSRLEDLLAGPEDLYRVRVCTVEGSTSEQYLAEKHIAYRTEESISDCLDALSRREVQAVVYDDAILRYYVNSNYTDVIEVLPETFEEQHYGILLPQGSALRETINLALLDLLASTEYLDIQFRYLGEK